MTIFGAGRTALVLVIVLMSGCFSSKYEDVSHEPGYRMLAGTYRTNVPMMVFGVTNHVRKGAAPDYYVVTLPPGTSGPEIVNYTPLAPGSRVNVIGVQRCTNCWPRRDDVVVNLPTLPQVGGRTTTLLKLGEKGFTRMRDGVILIDEALLTKINDDSGHDRNEVK